ncbi:MULTISPECIES: hypothetical protein [Piscinibacter]|uniref:hypothetical protein n=1 Tax=Piscinibacter TaxID=1114981 RepID=UPI000FDE8652|nr:hypothetical protein [Piscinibacter defluvii]
MSKPPRPAPKPRQRDARKKVDDRWLDLAREVARNPDSPTSLRIMSAVNSAMRPGAEAASQVVEALVQQINGPGELADAAIAAAVQHWESVCKTELGPDLLASMREEAAALAQRRRRQPPPMELIVAGVGEPVDMGYDLSLHLNGLRGTWHRLWAAIALGTMMGAGDEYDETVTAVRSQFEQLLGRSLSPDEWLRLSQHAQAHGEAMQSQFGEEGQAGPPEGAGS